MSRTSNDVIVAGRLIDGYDYLRQCWVIDGQYVDCNHPVNMGCICYGRKHVGEVTVDSGKHKD